jgi:Predicted membrane protein
LDPLLAVTNVVGIIAFSVAGSLKAIERRMDLLGVLTLGFSTSLAGGIIADVLLGKVPLPTSRKSSTPRLRSSRAP